MQKVTPFLWFDKEAEEAAKFYVSIFKNAKITATSRYNEAAAKTAGMPAGSVMTVAFELDGMQFTALNGGKPPDWDTKFTGAISFVVNCDGQEEVDYFWEKLGEGGQPGPCGWMQDKFGVVWQVVPKQLGEALGDPDPEKSSYATEQMMKMKKIEIAKLRKE